MHVVDSREDLTGAARVQRRDTIDSQTVTLLPLLQQVIDVYLVMNNNNSTPSTTNTSHNLRIPLLCS